MAFNNLTFVFGAPRSGTTWLAKILDSHPRVLYRHEPDTSHRCHQIPAICDAGEEERYLEPMRGYIRDLLAVRSIKAAGSLPVFPKTFDNRLTYQARVGLVYGLRLVQRTLPRTSQLGVGVPEFGNPLARSDVVPVIKSISAMGRIGIILRALPTARAILIVRNPLGQVASRLDGLARGKFERGGGFDRRLLVSAQARRFGLTETLIERLSLAEQLAWEWAVTNAMALDAVRGRPQTRVIRYMDLLDAPLQHARELVSFAGLPWHPANERFIHRSTSYQGPDLYYQVFRNVHAQKDKWRSRIDGTAERQILEVMRASDFDRLWPELTA